MTKMKLCPDLDFSTFSKLYKAAVGSILFDAAGVWGFKDAPDSNANHSQAMRCSLLRGLFGGDMGWDSCLVQQRCEIVKL